MATKNKVVKRVRTWTTKSGEKRTRTYYYEQTAKGTTRLTKSGKTTKQTFKSVTKKRQAQINTIDKAKAYLIGKSENLGSEKSQIILNEIKDGKTFTTQQIDERLSKGVAEKGKRDVKNLLRALGYSESEFIAEVGITQQEFDTGHFQKIGNDIKFTTATGKLMYFQWDYDAGFIS